MQIEIWSDVVCPWCYIGKRRFESGLEQFRAENPDVEVSVSYRAFQLDPTAPSGVSQPVMAAYEKKFGGPERAKELIDHVTQEAEAEGLEFRMDIAMRSNTALAHRLLVLGEQQGVQEALKERLMSAYFCEGKEIGDLDELVLLAAEVGIDSQVARPWLEGDGGRNEVAAQIEFAGSAEIHAVPAYVIDRQAMVPGAQSAKVFKRVLERAAAASL